jgi:adenylate cyclase
MPEPGDEKPVAPRDDAPVAGDRETDEAVLRSLGVPEELITGASGSGPLSAFFESLPRRGAEARTVTVADIEAQGGPPLPQMRELMLALGFEPPKPDEPSFTPEEAQAFIALWHQQHLWPFDEAVQIMRLYGRLMARIAQASVQQWFAVAEPRLRAAEPDEAQRALAAAESFDALLPAAEVVLTGVHRRWVEREAAQIAVRAAESRTDAGLFGGLSEVSILFCDLKDFTAFADRQGDGAAIRIIDDLAGIVTVERGEQASLTKLLGDGFMIVYPAPRPAVEAAIRIMDAMRAPHRPAIHASVHHGRALPREGDYFGATVNLAARLLTLAEADELLVTAPVVERCTELAWEHCGSERFRGFSDEIQVFRLSR